MTIQQIIAWSAAGCCLIVVLIILFGVFVPTWLAEWRLRRRLKILRRVCRDNPEFLETVEKTRGAIPKRAQKRLEAQYRNKKRR